ncbi:hypothetical protein GGQ84_002470 [Desulfitispora alkaliphila]|uniref:spore germination protein n=1 Tax=Desulfitispora alkaliphila TaxID=622674 RepID=UPI003D1B84A4
MVIRDFVIGEDQKVSAFIVFVDGLVQENLINDNILNPLMIYAKKLKPDSFSSYEYIKKSVLAFAAIKEVDTMEQHFRSILPS